MPRHFALLSIVLVLVAIPLARAAEKADAKAQEAEIRKAIAALEGCFNGGDAKSLAACFSPDGEFVGPSGVLVAGREKIEAAFRDFLAKHKTFKIRMGVISWRLATDDVALVDLITEMTPLPEGLESEPTFHVLLVKRDGQWLIGRMHEAISPDLSHQSYLNDLKWLVGDWAEEGSRETGVSVHSTCDWTASGNYLIRKFSAEGKNGLARAGTEVIGWDPRAHRIRSWIFDSDGSFGESVWTRDANRWAVKHTGTLADGSDASVTYIITPLDADTVTVQSKDHLVNGESQPDLPEIKLKRRPIEPVKTKPSESPKAPRRVLP